MTREDKWAKLNDDEKNKIIFEKICGRPFDRNECITCGDFNGGSNGCLNWAGFGILADKLGRYALHVRWEGIPGTYIIIKFTDYGEKIFQVQGDTPWDAAALAFLKLKEIKI